MLLLFIDAVLVLEADLLKIRLNKSSQTSMIKDLFDLFQSPRDKSCFCCNIWLLSQLHHTTATFVNKAARTRASFEGAREGTVTTPTPHQARRQKASIVPHVSVMY